MRAAGLAAGLIALLAAGCSSGSAVFPEETECAQPAPLPTSRNTPGVVSVQAYTGRIRGGADSIEKLRSDLRRKYGDDTFYRREEFRPDFATYADQTICTARALMELTAPDPRFERPEADLDGALNALIAHTLAGREAVRARNVSDYRDWFSGVDAKIAAARTAAYAMR